MRRWLLKTEPAEWSWDDQVRRGVEAWTGVRNHQAAGHLRAMSVGDQAFFYHTGDEKRIVGIVRVKRAAYADPTDETGRFVAVDVETVEVLRQPVTLAQVKAEPSLADMPLVRLSRLSVMPVTDQQWNRIVAMSQD
ncbi:MAG: EVE domain-containing protein [Phycisphaeraceae bacterium]|nr:EVE domain-containing protein [Phycisphaeraceae bacterium]